MLSSSMGLLHSFLISLPRLAAFRAGMASVSWLEPPYICLVSLESVSITTVQVPFPQSGTHHIIATGPPPFASPGHTLRLRRLVVTRRWRVRGDQVQEVRGWSKRSILKKNYHGVDHPSCQALTEDLVGSGYEIVRLYACSLRLRLCCPAVNRWRILQSEAKTWPTDETWKKQKLKCYFLNCSYFFKPIWATETEISYQITYLSCKIWWKEIQNHTKRRWVDDGFYSVYNLPRALGFSAWVHGRPACGDVRFCCFSVLGCHWTSCSSDSLFW